MGEISERLNAMFRLHSLTLVNHPFVINTIWNKVFTPR